MEEKENAAIEAKGKAIAALSRLAYANSVLHREEIRAGMASAGDAHRVRCDALCADLAEAYACKSPGRAASIRKAAERLIAERMSEIATLKK